MSEILDVVIVGAGLSGIGTACHLKRNCPDRSFVVLERRAASGGTWDLFRYPGIRSDSDMYTLGYNFKPWEEGKAIADGPSILKYVRETATEHGIDSLIEYEQHVKDANWDSDAQCWVLNILVGADETPRELRTRFLMSCAGYYKYDHGYQPDFPGREQFTGEFIHPQHWPEDLDYSDKKVVIIGSGATAVTLLPALAEKAADTVMLQRSPTWMVSRPSSDWLANLLRTILPSSWAYALTRFKNTMFQHWLYRRSRRTPEKVREMLFKGLRRSLGTAAESQMEHFTPSYDPWDQRMCLVPDDDLFEAIREGKGRIVTAEIEEILPRGIRLKSGEQLDADIIVSATGLEMEILGGVQIAVDGEPFDVPASWAYRGMMFSGLPNLLAVFGYINASWTLRADLCASWLCDLLNHMQDKGVAVVTPTLEDSLDEMEPRPYIDDFSAGYMRRVMHRFPKQGDRDPWINSQRFLLERKQFSEMNFDEEALRYESLKCAAEGSSESLEQAA
ncbi:MAG: NAD(P)/FAD-dependent oxidoreductase [Pseudomonadota bacterium]